MQKNQLRQQLVLPYILVGTQNHPNFRPVSSARSPSQIKSAHHLLGYVQ
jgi:hypothetical protein